MRQRLPSFFFTKKKGDAIGELEGQIHPDFRFSSKNSSRAFCSIGLRGYILQSTGLDPGVNSTA
jgi:hypothetical protein